jgi:uncharacterized protein
MPFSMSQASVPALEIGLNALSAILDKAQAFAAAKKIDPSVLLNMRLAPDMFAFVRQVQIACDLAKNGAGRLAGVEPPRYEDNETTIAQLKERISKTLSVIKGLDRKAIDGAADRQITFPLGPTNKGEMRDRVIRGPTEVAHYGIRREECARCLHAGYSFLSPKRRPVGFSRATGRACR